ncbi:hypothetical protein BDY21DRAFT_331469 [Lineolata rhizophorae]|uniref:NAD(P)-binding domain-containing protein n=1 Tax=Lineolata rhizophorae TaxID=578093 RepID=A0A6A6PEQ8_9PEZI|nr:hypothetical protein BDY21DRAFT_331469 [Lineolata rhizophorae]
MRVGVIGPTGFGGSYVCVELINRGHNVVGMSRHPEKLGTHPLYTARKIDIENMSIDELAKAFGDVDTLVSEYGPHTQGADALQYMPYLEDIRKIVLAVKEAKVKYFVHVGGTGSLYVPGTEHQCAVDCPDFFIAYRRGIADSHAHVCYMEERLGPMGSALRSYRNARLHAKEGKETEEDKAFVKDYEYKVSKEDKGLKFIRAGRTSFMFFDGNTSFRWTFVSPSALYRPGRRTGKYEVVLDELPLKNTPSASSNPLDGRLLGVSCADLAVAIADDVETQKLVFKHWTVVGDLSDDTPYPSYITLADTTDGKGSA